MKDNKYYIFIDGSCWPSPGYGYIGWGFSVTRDRKGGNRKGFYESFGLVDRSHLNTSPLSEYVSLYNALLWAKDSVPLKFLRIRSDNKMLVNQMNGIWRINPELPYGTLAQKCRNLVAELKLIGNFGWIPREFNKYADKLSNIGYQFKGIDTRVKKLRESEVYKVQSGNKFGIYVDGILADEVFDYDFDRSFENKLKKCYNFEEFVEYEVSVQDFPQNINQLNL